jgi:2-succinyl-6-hydroxy-2,4-cyclohexadiene-1-carboxylate synthase
MAGTLLHLETEGNPAGRRTVLVHGFTQTGACWGSIGSDLAQDHEVLRVDAPGHGLSTHAGADLWAGAQLLGDTCGPADYIGYSMGGRLCLHLAVSHPALVNRLVLIGATPGLRSAEARAQRRADDERLAVRLENIGVEAFLEEWLALPIFTGLDAEAAQLDARLKNTAEGLASSLRSTGTGTQEPLWDRLAGLDMPVLCAAGDADEKFLTIARQMSQDIGANATTVAVPAAGHTAHLENPDAFLATFRRWEMNQGG